ncbi:ribonuclease III [Telmatocola sphagniphila]|uniref:Ribonuclease 3 n=1 Tax=Telmatocola sphagniphila TaxID=1123043 RepID=A0A8E6B3M6_9BACT|nr:ribonuclease III [Telmatocola sphagniphila]QVL30516.1 ribonuclease III [Telmatocola sphagniphila]
MTAVTNTAKEDNWAELENILGYKFQRRELLVAALTHTSGANTREHSNERLEFLGDAVLGLVVVEELYLQHPNFHEGMMTKIKSAVVAKEACIKFSEQLELARFMILGRAIRSNPKIPGNVLADAFESLVAAVYLDSNFAVARDFILKFLKPEIDRVLKDEDLLNAAKSNLQQLCQKKFCQTPTYRVLDEQGPEHSRSFQVVVEVGDRRFKPAWGPSKKKAEALAAQNALDELGDSRCSAVPSE